MGPEAVAIICVGSIIANLLILWINIKLYTEVLKVEHIKGIGK